MLLSLEKGQIILGSNCVTSNAIVKLRYRSGKGQGQEGQSQDQLRELKTQRSV